MGISSVWYEGNTCNMHLNDLAAEVKLGVQEAGLVGYRFNTIGVSDAISMGTDGMSFSLQSRDLIADSIETVRPQHNLVTGSTEPAPRPGVYGAMITVDIVCIRCRQGNGSNPYRFKRALPG